MLPISFELKIRLETTRLCIERLLIYLNIAAYDDPNHVGGHIGMRAVFLGTCVLMAAGAGWNWLAQRAAASSAARGSTR